MPNIILVLITLVMLAGSGCATTDLHLKCRDVQTGIVAQTSDQLAIRTVLDLASRLEGWNKAEPIGADHLFTVYVRKLEESQPYFEMRVFHKHTRVTMLNTPDDPSDDGIRDELEEVAEDRPVLYHAQPDDQAGALVRLLAANLRDRAARIFGHVQDGVGHVHLPLAPWARCLVGRVVVHLIDGTERRTATFSREARRRRPVATTERKRPV